MSSVAQGVLSELQRLPEEKQQAVLDFVRALSRSAPRPRRGADVAHLAGTIRADDLEIMRKAIEDECERVDPRAW